MRTLKISFNSLTTTLFHSSIVYATGLYVYVWRGVFRTQLSIYGEAFLRKSQESVIAEVWPGSKYTSDIDLQ